MIRDIIKVLTLTVLGILLLALVGCSEIGTEYAPGYSEKAFQAIKIGDSREHVIAELGEPLRIVGHSLLYRYQLSPEKHVDFAVNTDLETATLSKYTRYKSPDQVEIYEHVETLTQLEDELGPPDDTLSRHAGQGDNPDWLSYSYSRSIGFRWNVRIVFIEKETGKVADKWAYAMVD